MLFYIYPIVPYASALCAQFLVYMNCCPVLQDLKFYDYRSAIAKAVPQLWILDDQAFMFDIIDGKRVIHSKSLGNTPGDAQFKEDLLLVQEFIKALPPIDENDVEPQVIDSGMRYIN